MKFLVDAHLPRRLADRLQEAGFDTVHTRDLPLANRTPDAIINETSIREKRIVITKDADFVTSFILYRQPYKLLLVSTGNITNRELEALFLRNLKQIVDAFTLHDFVEIDRKMLIIHM